MFTALFDRVRQGLGMESQEEKQIRLDAENFASGVSHALTEKAIPTARGVGAQFRLDDVARGKMKSIGMRGDFEEAVVIVSDQPEERAAAYMVGKTSEGRFAVVSLHNLGRPDDIGLTDKFTARREANQFRNMLGAIAQPFAPERSYASFA